MAKIIEFKRVKQIAKEADEIKVLADGVEDKISSIVNDYSLTPANRRWLLENLLMDVDDQLQVYKQELEQAELRLEKVVQSAEREIEAAYGEYLSRVTEMTESVKTLVGPTVKHRN